jgi:hypothetical protein
VIDDASSARLGSDASDASVGSPLGVVARVPAPPSTEGALPRFRRALGTTFLVHVVTALVAAVAAFSVSRALVGSAGPHPFFAEGFARGAPIAPETLATFGEHALGPLFLAGLGLLALQALVALPVSLLWLGAMTGEDGVLRRWPRHVLRGVGASVVLLVPLVLVAGLTVLLPALWHLAFDAESDPRVHDLGVLAAMLPGAAAAVRWASWSDHTRAAIALDASIGASLRAGFRAGATTEYVVSSLLALGLFGLGVWLSGVPSLGLALAQLAALARTFVRAFWLARAQNRVARVLAS